MSINLPLTHVSRPSTLKENAPLLVMLHGYGSDENDLFSFASELPEELFIISIRAPYPLQPSGNAWYAINFDAEQNKWNDNEQAKSSMSILIDCINQACDFYPVDKNNVSVLGFSQGTILGMATALNHPKKIKNIIGLSGYVNHDILPENLEELDYSKLSIYCSHGTVDQVIPIDWARQTPVFLKSLNIDHTYSEFPVGHGVAPQNFYELRDWISSKI
ncbi:alpha/beta fold hydrolase [Flavobacteriaceae bacterium]|jgi:phospholipase/carboxylesterase|nr:alpha/beta fold hydrolase [Flavobacteriaceae bacterium]MDC1259648.1 alpha/beta fold hydrolase [Flavobacteriaceae bacterium]MDG1385145.1 alpha/beta fold hydrolase [Flavobacteriaceae bacterium]